MDIIRRSGFTLAEVLITLSIIGVVAALTIPSLVVKNQEKQTVTRVQKAYNILTNAFSLAIVQSGGGPQTWGWSNFTIDQDGGVIPSDPEGAKRSAQSLLDNLNVMKSCGNSYKGCFAKEYKFLDGSGTFSLENNLASTIVMLNDGLSLRIGGYDKNCETNRGIGVYKNICGLISFDINGEKGPNVMGKDYFTFWITESGVYPLGGVDNTLNPISDCTKDGGPCTAWILQKQNMDYLKGPVSWD